MRRTLLCIAGALALAVALTACGGGGDDDPGPSANPDALTVHAKDTLKFDKTTYTAKAGEVDVRYINDGTIAHTLLVKDVKGFELKVPGKDEGTVDLEAGTYTLYCDIAGHEAAGMKATLTVR
jgi:plastocyanin